MDRPARLVRTKPVPVSFVPTLFHEFYTTMRMFLRPQWSVFLASCCLGVCVLTGATQTARANPALDGYANHEAFTKQLVELDQSDLVQMTSLGKSVGGRDVWLLTIGAGKVDEKPAIVVVGNVYGPHLVGGELALRVARQLVTQAAKDEKTRKLDRKSVV